MLGRGQSEDLRRPHGVIENALKIFENGAQLPPGDIHGHSQFYWVISGFEVADLLLDIRKNDT